MNRREAIDRVALIMGGIIIGADFFLSGCKSGTTKTSNLFTAKDIEFLNEVAETILPETATPGAKAAKVGQFIVLMVNDCYAPEEQKIFIAGMAALKEKSSKDYGLTFTDLDARKKTAFLTGLDLEQKENAKNTEAQHRIHCFKMIKELTLLGYFTSEPGCTKSRRYVPVPGKYIGCIPYTKGDKAWAR